jgi:hypothetical protein
MWHVAEQKAFGGACSRTSLSVMLSIGSENIASMGNLVYNLPFPLLFREIKEFSQLRLFSLTTFRQPCPSSQASPTKLQR